MKQLLSGLFVLLATQVWGQKSLQYADKVYEPQIRSVQLYPFRNGFSDSVFQAVAPLGQMNLVLEFDDLQASRDNYYVRIMHCNWDWSKSVLMDLDYLTDYNEFPINDYALSGNTQIPYLHYAFPLPQVKLSGNYLVVVYRDGNKSDVILSHRFMVYADMVSLIRDNQYSGGTALNQANQPLSFTIDYGRLDIMNPVESVHVILRQNQRWDNAKMDTHPSFVRDSERQLEFHFPDQENIFSGGNEFRFVDFRSLNYPGQNTGKINKTVKPFQLSVLEDLPRTDEAYAQYNDLNGNYQVDNRDYGDPKTSANYVQVTFTLNPIKAIQDPVYLVGGFNNWDRNDENRMQYIPARGTYEASILLKQGFYNYQYWVDSRTLPSWHFEGSHFETENIYEVLVYNHSFQPNADMLIGYFVIPVNPH